MKKISLLVSMIMAITVFWIPGQSVFADNEEGAGEPSVQAMATVQISFDANGGSGSMDPQTVNTGETVGLPENSFTWDDNHRFLGWATTKARADEGTVDYADRAEVTINEDSEGMTLYAVWEDITPAPVVPTFNKGTISRYQAGVVFNWSWSNGTGTVKIRLYKSRISDGNSSYYYDKTLTNETIFRGLSDGTTYYYTITATPNGGEKVTYTGQVTTLAKKANGWLTVGNDKYYYQNGVKKRCGTIKLRADGCNLYHYFDCDGIFVGRRAYMYSRIKSLSSKTYLICVDRTNNVVCVYKGGKNKWRPYLFWSCVTGRMKKGDYHPTPLGIYKVKSKKKTFSGYGVPEKKKNRYSVWHCTRFTGSVFFHSQLYKYRSTKAFIPGGRAMGVNASHGCVRLHKSNAYWIYKNIAKGTTVVVIQ